MKFAVILAALFTAGWIQAGEEDPGQSAVNVADLYFGFQNYRQLPTEALSFFNRPNPSQVSGAVVPARIWKAPKGVLALFPGENPLVFGADFDGDRKGDFLVELRETAQWLLVSSGFKAGPRRKIHFTMCPTRVFFAQFDADPALEMVEERLCDEGDSWELSKLNPSTWDLESQFYFVPSYVRDARAPQNLLKCPFFAPVLRPGPKAALLSRLGPNLGREDAKTLRGEYLPTLYFYSRDKGSPLESAAKRTGVAWNGFDALKKAFPALRLEEALKDPSRSRLIAEQGDLKLAYIELPRRPRSASGMIEEASSSVDRLALLCRGGLEWDKLLWWRKLDSGNGCYRLDSLMGGMVSPSGACAAFFSGCPEGPRLTALFRDRESPAFLGGLAVLSDQVKGLSDEGRLALAAGGMDGSPREIDLRAGTARP